MTTRLLLFLLLILSGCKSKPDTLARAQQGKTDPVASAVSPASKQLAALIPEKSEPVCQEKEASDAALNKLYPVLGGFDETSVSALDAADNAIACYRPWALTISDACQRSAIGHWLDFYEGQVKRSREKLAAGKHEAYAEEQMRKYREEQARAAAWERKHPFPKLPQCESKVRP